MAVGGIYTGTLLNNIQMFTSSVRASLSTIRPLYNLSTAIATARGGVAMPAGIIPTGGLFGFGLLGGISPANLQLLAKLQALAQPGLRSPAGFSLPF